MREIKFRAWEKGKMQHFGLDFADCYAMSKTVMQFTGLRDKNGKDIYEGDILECTEIYYNNTGQCRRRFIGTVEWLYDGYHMQPRKSLDHIIVASDDDGVFFTDMSLGEGKDLFEVIGNIYENLELAQSLHNEQKKETR